MMYPSLFSLSEILSFNESLMKHVGCLPSFIIDLRLDSIGGLIRVSIPNFKKQ